ncbi:hypothetical protein K7432_007383 [Basidiobolus ranarum]|uniref:Uncharacterized protein n=1 Tax=Basidiobolus ranarum TaxID=34480 RepID=A0ABR2W055_9FUNG
MALSATTDPQPTTITFTESTKSMWNKAASQSIRTITDLRNTIRDETLDQQAEKLNSVVASVQQLGFICRINTTTPVTSKDAEVKKTFKVVMAGLLQLMSAFIEKLGMPDSQEDSSISDHAMQLLYAITNFSNVVLDAQTPLELRDTVASDTSFWINDINSSLDEEKNEHDLFQWRVSNKEFVTRLSKLEGAFDDVFLDIHNSFPPKPSVIVPKVFEVAYELLNIIELLNIPLLAFSSELSSMSVKEDAFRLLIAKKKLSYYWISELLLMHHNATDASDPFVVKAIVNLLNNCQELQKIIVRLVQSLLKKKKDTFDQHCPFEWLRLNNLWTLKTTSEALLSPQTSCDTSTVRSSESFNIPSLTVDSHKNNTSIIIDPSNNSPKSDSSSTSSPLEEQQKMTLRKHSKDLGIFPEKNTKRYSAPNVLRKGSNHDNIVSHSGEEKGLKQKGKKIFRNFFGFKSEPTQSVIVPESANNPWFMHTDIDSENLTVDSSGLILGGTLEALVEYMTQHDTTMDLQFVKIFLLTFRSFTTQEQLVSCLSNRFLLQPDRTLLPSEIEIWTTGKLTPIRLRIYMIFKLWLTLYYVECFDGDSIELIRQFFLEVMGAHLPAESKDLIKLLEAKCTKTKPINVRPLSVDSCMNIPENRRAPPPVPLLSPYVSAALKAHKGFFIAELDPLELARQFTILESKEFCAIQPHELIDKEFSKKSSVSVHVQAMTKLSTAITTWIADCIVREEDLKNRSNILKYFIRVGEKCLQLQNYNTLFSIVSALNSSGVNRLKRTQELLSRKYSIILNNQSSVVNRHKNFHDYREILRRSSPPCLPFLGLYLTDLTFTYDGNKDFRKEKPHQLNLDKHRRVVTIIESLSKFQSPYALVEVPEIQNYLHHVLNEVNLAMKDIKDIGDRVYSASLTVEPKIHADGHTNTCMSLDYYMAV